METFIFDCNGNKAPAYGCDKPGNNSGVYVLYHKAIEEMEGKDKRIKELESALAEAAHGMLKFVKDNI